MGPIHCFETSGLDYQTTLLKIPEGRRCHLQHGGSLKSCGYEQDVKYGIKFRLQRIKPAHTHIAGRDNYRLQIQCMYVCTYVCMSFSKRSTLSDI